VGTTGRCRASVHKSADSLTLEPGARGANLWRRGQWLPPFENRERWGSLARGGAFCVLVLGASLWRLPEPALRGTGGSRKGGETWGTLHPTEPSQNPKLLTIWNPTLCKERKGWATRRKVGQPHSCRCKGGPIPKGVRSWESHPLQKAQRMGHPAFFAREATRESSTPTISSRGRHRTSPTT
jgi:hypothetical protein